MNSYKLIQKPMLFWQRMRWCLRSIRCWSWASYHSDWSIYNIYITVWVNDITFVKKIGSCCYFFFSCVRFSNTYFHECLVWFKGCKIYELHRCFNIEARRFIYVLWVCSCDRCFILSTNRSFLRQSTSCKDFFNLTHMGRIMNSEEYNGAMLIFYNINHSIA